MLAFPAEIKRLSKIMVDYGQLIVAGSPNKPTHSPQI